MLGIMEQELPGGITGFIPTATQLGYAAGPVLLVRSDDIIERRRLIVVQFVAWPPPWSAPAVAPRGAGRARVALRRRLRDGGATDRPARRHSPPRRDAGPRSAPSPPACCAASCSAARSRATCAEFWGWREMFWLGVPRGIGRRRPDGAPLAAASRSPDPAISSLLGSLAGLWREFPTLRLASVTQALLFATFIVFWTILALHLQEPRFHLGARDRRAVRRGRGGRHAAAPLAGGSARPQRPRRRHRRSVSA